MPLTKKCLQLGCRQPVLVCSACAASESGGTGGNPGVYIRIRCSKISGIISAKQKITGAVLQIIMRVTSYNGPAALMVVTACNEENGNGLHRISSLDRPNGRCAYPRTAGLLDDLTHTTFHSVILLGRLGVLFLSGDRTPLPCTVTDSFFDPH